MNALLESLLSLAVRVLHWPPLDTLDAHLQAESDLKGSVQMGLSSSLAPSEWTVVGENGHVVVTEVSVTSKILGREEVKQSTADIFAVPSEVRAPKEQQTFSGRRSQGWQVWNW